MEVKALMSLVRATSLEEVKEVIAFVRASIYDTIICTPNSSIF